MCCNTLYWLLIMEQLNKEYSTFISISDTAENGVEMTKSAFEKVKKYIREAIKNEAIEKGLQVLDNYEEMEESPISDFINEYNKTAKGKSKIDLNNRDNRMKLLEWWCWFSGTGIDKLRNELD